jgi:hypothetical protein
MENQPDQIPPCPGGPPSHIRRWEAEFGEAARVAEAESAGAADQAEPVVEPVVEEEAPKAVVKKKAKKKTAKKKATKKKAGK